MSTGIAKLLISGLVLAAALVSCVRLGIPAAVAEAGSAPVTNSSSDLVTALKSAAPHSSLADHTRAIDRLVGAWDVEYTDFAKDGKIRHRTGALLFGWVLDGRVMQDLWIVDPSTTGKEREVYTDLFYFDPKSETWHVASIDPYAASVATFAGGAVGDDRIVLDSHDLVPNEARRWSFNDIGMNSLVFRDEASSDGGKTWKLKSEYHMKRRNDDSSTR